MPTPRPILTCHTCGHDLSELITTPWVHKCPECGSPFNRDFFYEGSPKDEPEPNALPDKVDRPIAPGDTTPDRPKGDHKPR